MSAIPRDKTLREPFYQRFLKKAFMLAVAGYAVIQVGETSLEFQNSGNPDISDYPAHLISDTFGDAGTGLRKTVNFAANIYGGITGNDVRPEHADRLTLLIPPSVSHAGWDNPAPGTRMYQTKVAVSQELKRIIRGVATPGHPYNQEYGHGAISVRLDPRIVSQFDPARDNDVSSYLDITKRTASAFPNHDTMCYSIPESSLERIDAFHCR